MHSVTDGIMVASFVLRLVTCLLLVTAVQGGGRAFPLASENFITSAFQRINPNINWDHTNFLVDLAGHSAICQALKRPPGASNVDRPTKDGRPIVQIVDRIDGRDTHVVAVTRYLEQIIKRWMTTRVYNAQIQRSTCFGCSVRPGCDRQTVVACLFSSSSCGIQWHPPAKPIPRTTRRTRPPPAKTIITSTTTTARPTTTTTPAPLPPDPISGVQRALAFTPQQYDVAEDILGTEWDKSHYLENLSGYETRCEMLGTKNWAFDYLSKFNAFHHLNIRAQYGYERNVGSTPKALHEILARFEPMTRVKDLGCSLIADCRDARRQMHVVVCCLYEY